MSTTYMSFYIELIIQKIQSLHDCERTGIVYRVKGGKGTKSAY